MPELETEEGKAVDNRPGERRPERNLVFGQLRVARPVEVLSRKQDFLLQRPGLSTKAPPHCALIRKPKNWSATPRPSG